MRGLEASLGEGLDRDQAAQSDPTYRLQALSVHIQGETCPEVEPWLHLSIGILEEEHIPRDLDTSSRVAPPRHRVGVLVTAIRASKRAHGWCMRLGLPAPEEELKSTKRYK